MASLAHESALASSGPHPIRFHHDGLRWLADPLAQTAIRSLEGWGALAERRDFRTLKARKDRAVLLGRLRAPAGEWPVVVKTMSCTRLYLHFLHFFGPTRAAREWRHHLEARRAGLPVVPLLGLGERYRYGTPVSSVLVAEHWEHDGTLESLAGANDAAASLPGLLREFGDVVRRIHALGFLHGDLHPGNVLCRRSGADRLRVIDWKHVERRRNVPGGALPAQIAKLVWQFRTAGVFRADLPELEDDFFEGYAGGAGLGTLRSALEGEVARIGERLAERAARRCTGSNSSFVRVEDGGLIVLARRAPGLDALPAPLRSVEGLRATVGDEEVVLSGASGKVVVRHVPSSDEPSRGAWERINAEYARHGTQRLPLAWIEVAGASDEGWLCSLEGASDALEADR